MSEFFNRLPLLFNLLIEDPRLGIFCHIFAGGSFFSRIKTPSSFGCGAFLKSSGSFVRFQKRMSHNLCDISYVHFNNDKKILKIRKLSSGHPAVQENSSVPGFI